MNLYQMLSSFKSDKEFRDYLIQKRWPKEIRCTFCGGNQVIPRRDSGRFKCKCCNRSFSVTSGTIMHATKIPLSKWFMAISIIANAKKGVSSLQLSRDLGVNKNTAWYLQMRIRSAMDEDPTLGGLMEPMRYRSRQTRKQLRRHDSKKQVPTYSPLIISKLGIKSNRPRTDEMISLKIVSRGKNSRTDIILTRAIAGQFHRLNLTHLARYIHEIIFKANHRQEDQFNLMLSRCIRGNAIW